MCTILWRIHFFPKCLVCLLFVCLVFGQNSTTVYPTTSTARTTTDSDICTAPAAPRCNATYTAETSVNITCDISQTNASACQLEDLTILCEAVEENNQNFTWIVRERNFSTDVSNSTNNSTHLLVTIDELSEYTNYSCNVTLNNGTSDHSLVNFTTLEGVPSAPQNLTTTEISQNNFTISWIEPVKIPGILLNYQVNVQTLSANHQILENCTDPDYNVNETINVLTNTNYTYTNALPDVNYNVSVLGITSSGNGETATIQVTTESSASEAPRQLQCVPGDRDDGNYTVLFWVETSWAPPCNTNGEGNFSLVLNGYYTENSTVIHEANYTEEFLIGQMNYSLYFVLRPSSQYDFYIYVAGKNGLQGKTANCSFSTNDTYPGAPTLNPITNVSSYSFDISWAQPEGTPGKILSYNVTVTSHGPLYNLPSYDCEYDVDTRTYAVEADTNFYSFTEGKPYYNYTVYVTASTSRGNGPPSSVMSVTTETFTPGSVINLTANYTDHSSQALLNCDLILNASWELPCDVNGVIQSYFVTLTGTYSEGQSSAESKSEVVTESTYQRALSASTNYNLTVEISLTDGSVGQAAWKEFTTPSCFPGAPIWKNTREVEAKSFNISWLPPSENRGELYNYYLNLTKLGPVMTYRNDCIYESGFEVYNISQQTVFRYKNAVPFSRYEIQVFGETAKGNGSTQTTTITTSDSVPENVVNKTYSITMSNNTTYNSTAYINFGPPCFTNGELQNYFVSFSGVRENFPNHINNVSLPRNNTNYDFALRPDHNYSVIIAIHTVSYSNSSPAIEFNSPSGVPQFSSNTTLPTPAIADATKATVSLKRSHFDETNGEIKYIALIISDANVTGGDYNEWTDKNLWPEPHSSLASVYYQANEKYWMPFSDSVSEVDFVIGNNTTCNETQFCNRVLNESTTYYLIVRVFTDNFYKNSWPIDFTTASISNRLVKILVPLFSLIFLALCLWIIFVLWYKKKIRCNSFRFAEKIYSRHTSAKPPCEPITEVSLNKFVNYCKHLENNPEKLKSQYQLLGEKTKEVTAEHTTVFALLPENRRKNRYTNILPYDQTRVKLFMDEDDDLATDYINASYIRGFSGSIQYIATQGPLPDTCRDFWKMVLQENVSMIVMVSNFIENNKIKCYKYFPSNHENMMMGDDIEVRCSTELHFGTYCVRTLQVKRDLKQIHVTHLQFLDWPDFGVPQGTENMLQFCYQFQERQRLEGGCVVVHCSAGVGRTGTMIATDILLRHIKAGKKSVDVFKTVLDLRLQRVNMVQTEGQYMYIHSLIKDNLLEDPETKERIQTEHNVLYENLSSVSQDNMGIVHMESKF